MSDDISSIAFAIRAKSAESPHPIKLSHAQQCAAAAFGYGTLAAYQASPDERANLHGASHVLVDVARLVERAQDLGLPHDEKALIGLIDAAFSLKLPHVAVHANLDQLEDALRDQLQQVVLNHRETSSAMAETNSNGIDEVYLPLDVLNRPGIRGGCLV